MAVGPDDVARFFVSLVVPSVRRYISAAYLHKAPHVQPSFSWLRTREARSVGNAAGERRPYPEPLRP